MSLAQPHITLHSEKRPVRAFAKILASNFEKLLEWLYSSPNPKVRWYTERNPMAHGDSPTHRTSSSKIVKASSGEIERIAGDTTRPRRRSAVL